MKKEMTFHRQCPHPVEVASLDIAWCFIFSFPDSPDRLLSRKFVGEAWGWGGVVLGCLKGHIGVFKGK